MSKFDGWTLCPGDGGVPRIVRFVEDSQYKVLAHLDFDTNVLTVVKPLYDSLSDDQKHKVLTCRVAALDVAEAGGKVYTVSRQ